MASGSPVSMSDSFLLTAALPKVLTLLLFNADFVPSALEPYLPLLSTAIKDVLYNCPAQHIL